MRSIIAACVCLYFTASAMAQLRALPENQAQLQLSFAPIVKKAAPAVVNVYSTRTVQNPMAAFLNDPIFRQFLAQQGMGGMKKERVESSLGSGAIISPDGLIITNNHVIANADEVKVALSDKREFEADIVLRDERTDLAVLKLKTKGETFTALEFGDLDQLQVGDFVLAIGNPFGVGQTVTSGIVSALARTRVGIGDYGFFIQTDAAINPGNSGGPLIDMSGRLVGLNTAIYSRSGGNIGIGFAIPANMVKIVAQSAQTGGKMVRRPWLGATFQNITGDIAESLNLKDTRGALVASVTPKSPASIAGLQTGDIIVTVDGNAIDDASALGFRVATKNIGSTAELEILRKGTNKKLQLNLQTAPETKARESFKAEALTPLQGATFGNLSPALAEELNMDLQSEGVAVMTVDNNTPADRLGLRRGDILRNLNGKDLTTTAELRNILSLPSRSWRVSIQRGAQVLTVVVTG